MTTSTEQSLETFIGETLYDVNGDKIGKIDDIYLDEQTGRPEWVAVSTGLFGTHLSFAPLSGVSNHGDRLSIPFESAQVKDAPRVEPDGALSFSEEDELYAYYGFGPESAYDNSTDATNTVGRDTSGPTTDEAMTRSEEELYVGTKTRETGKARLRKYLVTEHQTVTVPVTHEEVRIVREPITGANVDSALGGPELSEEEHEVTLHAEEAVVNKKVVPKERVRLDVDEVTEQQSVDADITKERIDVEGDADQRQ